MNLRVFGAVLVAGGVIAECAVEFCTVLDPLTKHWMIQAWYLVMLIGIAFHTAAKPTKK